MSGPSRRDMQRTCASGLLLSARGVVSVIFPSGDDGVRLGNYVTDDGSVHFLPSFLTTRPRVTTVGGTTGFFPEEGGKFSGDGFSSSYFQCLNYQQQAVPTFVQRLGDTVSGRGIPDIAVQAMRFPVFVNGVKEYVDGASGSIIALLNEHQVFPRQGPSRLP
ncbi:hypothetical protein H4582DRAFT_2076588 [Lactarius indigo]|nr:hypothetical protein H4582DRAFT_2076588 [Lactarius indigo]